MEVLTELMMMFVITLLVIAGLLVGGLVLGLGFRVGWSLYGGEVER